MSTNSSGREVFQDVDPDPDAVLEAFGGDDPDDILAIADDQARGDAESDSDASGRHDVVPDDRVDADDVTAAELFSDLDRASKRLSAVSNANERADPGPADSVDAADGSTASDSTAFDWVDVARDPEEADADPSDAFDAVFETDPTVDVLPDDGSAVDVAVEAVSLERSSTGPASDLESADTASSGPDSHDSVGSNSSESVGDARDESTSVTDDDGAGGPELVGPDPTPTRITNDAFGTGGTGE
ncbi:hypothetical protein ACFQGT_13250 [Natrialbaceae archaeon GCM10025810]|uniref:hypothetical protein n=1 Tax=Halovalidus salilacus TaxID=3075124 RepID=UPI003609EC28